MYVYLLAYGFFSKQSCLRPSNILQQRQNKIYSDTLLIRGLTVSVKFELDNGKTKEYETWSTEYVSEGYCPDKPHYTKCGLSFKKNPVDGACDHLDCAMDAAKKEAIGPVVIYWSLFIMVIIAGWYEKGDPLAGIRESGYLIVFGIVILLMSAFPFRRWLELREYKNHGTIHRRTARRL